MSQMPVIAAEVPVVVKPVDPVVVAAPVKDGETTTPVEKSAVDKAHLTAQKARRSSSKRREAESRAQVASYNASIAQQENARLRAETQAVRDQQAAFRADPYKALRDAGLSDTQIAAKVAQDGSMEQAVENLKAELKKESDARKALEDGIKNEKESAKESARQAEYLVLANDEKKFPYLCQLPDEMIISQTITIINQLANRKNPETGRPANEGVTLDQIAAWLDSLCANKAKGKKLTPVTETEIKQAVVEETAAPETSKVVATDKSKAPPPKFKTLTQKSGTTKFSLPANFDSLPDHKQRSLLAEQLRQNGLAK